MAMQPDGQTALHLAAEESKFDCSMLEVKQCTLKYTQCKGCYVGKINTNVFVFNYMFYIY